MRSDFYIMECHVTGIIRQGDFRRGKKNNRRSTIRLAERLDDVETQLANNSCIVFLAISVSIFLGGSGRSSTGWRRFLWKADDCPPGMARIPANTSDVNPPCGHA